LFLNSINELHAGTDQWQEGSSIQPPPALLGHVEQFKCHEQSFGSRACALSWQQGTDHNRKRDAYPKADLEPD
jgi:hypothetical protein